VFLVSKHRGFSKGIRGYQSGTANSKAPQNVSTTSSQKYDSFAFFYCMFVFCYLQTCSCSSLSRSLGAEVLFLCVVVKFWSSSRSWFVSHRIRSVSSEQQTWHTSWTIAGPRRKPWILLRVHAHPEVPLWHPQLSGPSLIQGLSLISATTRSLFDPIPLSDIRNCQVPFWPHLSGIVHRIFNSDGTVSLIGSPDPHTKGPPRRLPTPYWIQLSSRIFWFTESVTLANYLHVLNVSALLSQWG